MDQYPSPSQVLIDDTISNRLAVLLAEAAANAGEVRRHCKAEQMDSRYADAYDRLIESLAKSVNASCAVVMRAVELRQSVRD